MTFAPQIQARTAVSVRARRRATSALNPGVVAGESTVFIRIGGVAEEEVYTP